MLRPLKWLSQKVDNTWQSLPWWAKGLLSAQRWYLGIKGLPAMWALVVALISAGVLTLVSFPMATKALWGSAAAIAAFAVAGHVGAGIKARSGNLRVMSDVAFREYATELADDAARFLIVGGVLKIKPQSAEIAEEMKALVGSLPIKRRRAVMRGESVAVFMEAKRRGFLSAKECARFIGAEDVKEVHEGLEALLASVPLLTGHVDRR